MENDIRLRLALMGERLDTIRSIKRSIVQMWVSSPKRKSIEFHIPVQNGTLKCFWHHPSGEPRRMLISPRGRAGRSEPLFCNDACDLRIAEEFAKQDLG